MMISMHFVLVSLLGIGPSKATFSYWEYGTVVECLPSKLKAAGSAPRAAQQTNNSV